MKKILSYAVLAMCMFTFAACSDDEGPGWSADNINSSNGVFIINSGNQKNGISGSVSYYDYKDGTTVQKGCSSDMIYGVDELIAYISKFFTLKTGDLLYTGTPVGVGPVKVGDHLEGFLEDRKVLDFSCK